MNVIELPKATISDIPRVLRAIAAEIEAGDYGKTVAATLVIESDANEVKVFGAGVTDFHRGISLLTLGKEKLLRTWSGGA